MHAKLLMLSKFMTIVNRRRRQIYLREPGERVTVPQHRGEGLGAGGTKSRVLQTTNATLQEETISSYSNIKNENSAALTIRL